jgi:hypothetical protein
VFPMSLAILFNLHELRSHLLLYLRDETILSELLSLLVEQVHFVTFVCKLWLRQVEMVLKQVVLLIFELD